MSLVAVIAIGSTACNMGTAAVTAEGREIYYQYTAEELKDDFNQFRRIIERKIARLYTDQDELEKDLREAENSINRPMTELEFYRLLSPIVADPAGAVEEGRQDRSDLVQHSGSIRKSSE